MAEEHSLKDKFMIYLDQVARFAAENPQEFLVSFFIILTPLMLICGYLSYLMLKQIEEKEKSKKKKSTRSSNIAKTRKKVAKAD